MYVVTTFCDFRFYFLIFRNFIFFQGFFFIFIVLRRKVIVFHEQQILESIDFRISNHRKSLKIADLLGTISPRPLGVS